MTDLKRNSEVLRRWLGGGLKTCMLPTGVIFAFRLPDVEDMLAKGLIPDDLRKEALKFGASAINPETMDVEGLERLLRFMRVLVSQSLRYIWDGPVDPIEAWAEYAPDAAEWQPVTLTAADLEEAAIDADDYAALQGIVSRQFTARQITAQSLGEHKFIPQEQADQIIAEEQSRTVPGWASFRGERRRAPAGAAGGSVAGQTVGNRGRKRPARSGGARRSSS